MVPFMIVELLIRFIIGGVIVSLFAVFGEVFKPKSFAGIFGAAPSVALATLGLTFALKSGPYVAIEGRSMVAGAVALFGYSLLIMGVLLRRRTNALVTTGTSILLWLVIAFGLWALFLR